MTASDSSLPGRGQPSPNEGGDSSLPRFDIVVRGYDRRQVDEYVADLEETISRQRSELEQARGSGASRSGAAPLFESGSRNSETGGLTPEMIGAFTTRLQSILQAAEEEAEEVRTNARNFARKEEEASRARLDALERRRDGVLDSLTSVRSQLDSMLTEVRGAGKEAPPTPPRGTSAGSARPESGPRPEARPDGARPESRPEPGPRPGGEGKRPSPTPRSEPVTERQGGDFPVRPRPNPGPGAPSPSVAPSPTPGPKSPSPTPQSGSGPGGLPTRQPGGAPSPHPKPRPTPSPRPRAGGAPSPLQGPQIPERGTTDHARNGVINRANGTGTRGDDPDDGRSAFGTGAR